jgi:hypothetical protein
LSGVEHSQNPDSDRPPDIRGLDAVETVSRHPQWYFRKGEFDLDELVAHLVEEATRAGARSVYVRRDGDWISVSADQDWLGGDVAAFFAPMSYPEGGPNSARVEVALTAFCDAVVTAEGGDRFYQVKSPPEDRAGELVDLLRPPEIGRMVAFLPPAAWGTEDEEPIAESAYRPGLRLVQGEGEARITSAVQSFVRKVRDASTA